jgi:hypothetical protein
VVPPSVSVKDCAILVPIVSLELCTSRISNFIGSDKPSSPVTTLLNCTPCLKDVVGGGMRPRVKTSPVGRGLISM